MQLRAIEAAFYDGVRLRPDAVFTWKGDPKKLPKWAVPVDSAVKAKSAPAMGDTKPKAAQDAVKQKINPLGDGEKKSKADDNLKDLV